MFQRELRPLTRIGTVCSACLLAGWLFAVVGWSDDSRKFIQGTIDVRPDLVRHVSPEDRLVIKLFHPGDGVELDAKYAILAAFSLPVDFRIAPTFDMSGGSKWKSYVVQVFTDKDGDVLSVAPGELLGDTQEPVPLGTTGLVLELNALRK
jgi:hypothetical protein